MGPSTYTKTVDENDYQYISEIVADLKCVASLLAKYEVRVEIGHPHRFWEYGMAVSAAEKVLGNLKGAKVLDVGAGASLLGPALSWTYEAQVSEAEPDFNFYPGRCFANAFLKTNSMPEIRWFNQGVGELPEEKFDAVFCISVLEHCAPHVENRAWKNLASRVRPGGLLFVTVDCMPRRTGAYTFDNLRQQNFVVEDIQARTKTLLDEFEFIGTPDWTYRPNYVFDYSFLSVGMRKKNG